MLGGVVGGGDCVGGEVKDGEIGWEDRAVAGEPDLVMVRNPDAGFFCERYSFILVLDEWNCRGRP